MNFFIKIYGCQYNEWDGARISFVLNKLGLIESDEKEADVILLLNCSVRKTAVDRAMSMVKNWAGKRVILAGCVLPDDKPKFLKKGVQIWDGQNLEELIKILEVRIKNKELSEKQLTIHDVPCTNFIPIMKGCNNFCSYCAVPYTRGREVSRPMADIIADAKRIIAAGQKEIILLGQNVNSYNPEKKEVRSKNNGFSDLLKQLNDIPGDFVIKFTSNHPKDMSDDIIEAIATLPKVAKEIHLPFQSGSNKILKLMNRPYTIEQYMKLVSNLKLKIKNLKLSTDTIVGFPGETEEDFQATVNVLKKVNFAQAFNNKYSPRKGTAAFKLGDPIPWSEKERRWRILNEISNKK